MIFLISILRTFFSPERTRALLGGKRQGIGNVLAALLGIVTPFCSCSAVPLFIGFVESGIPLGVTFSFLIAAPTINEVAIVMLFGLFGWKVAGLYILSGLIIAILAGMVIGRLNLERYVEDFVWKMQATGSVEGEKLTWSDRIQRAWESVKEIVGKVWLYVMVGIAVGAGIHGYVPESALVGIMGKQAWWSVPAAVLLGVPLIFQCGRRYSDRQRIDGKRCISRYRTGFHDGSSGFEPSGDNHSASGAKAPTYRGIYWHGCPGNHHYRLFVQSGSLTPAGKTVVQIMNVVNTGLCCSFRRIMNE